MKHPLSRSLVLVMATLVLLVSGGWVAVSAQTPEASPIASPAPGEEAEHGIRIEDMDLLTDPGEDFYRFSNGGWLDRTELPGTSPSVGVFDQLQDEVTAQIAEVVLDLDPDEETDTGKVAVLYDQFTDEDQRNADSIEPIAEYLERIQAIDSVEAAEAYMAEHAWDPTGIFGIYAGPSLADATLNVLYVGPAGLQLPDASYYTDDSEDGQAIIDAWLDTNAQMFQILGYTEAEAEAAAQDYFDFESALAGIMTPAEAYNDPSAYNNPITLGDLKEKWPTFDWDTFFATLEVDATGPMYADDIQWLDGIAGVLGDATPEQLVAYLQASLVWSNAAYLSLDIADLSFAFFSGMLYGVTERRPIEERGIYVVQDVFPDALGQAYVAEAFPPEAKAEIEALVQNLITAFEQRIRENTWMSDATKEEALKKLDLMAVKVGYPDTWKTYEDVAIGDSLFATIDNANLAVFEENLSRVGQPVDRTEWGIAPFTVNAYYNPQMNEIVFPAAILQAPFFDPEADLASNYGAIGFVIGHEITHGFDQSGSNFDGEGNIVQWWTDEDAAAFEDLQQQLIDQYDAIEVAPGVNVDGALTIGENIADLGGLQTAYDALLVALGEEGQEDQPWFLTQQQRFFVAASSAWREKATPEWVEYLVANDVHAPASVRGVQPLRNMDTFYEAFGIDESDPVWLPEEERIVIW
jgi:putative endopeptidase